MTVWLDLAEIVALHETIMRRMGWVPAAFRDEGGLESAVVRPQMAAHYEDADLVRQAALPAVGISQARAFLDGNKRTAYAALELFLLVNGLAITANPLLVAQRLEAAAEAADRQSATAAFEDGLRSHVAVVGG